MADFFRIPTPEEKKDFIDVMDKARNAQTRFIAELCKCGQEAMKQGLPFASVAAQAEFEDAIQDQVKGNVRKNGFLNWNEIKIPELDLSKYSNLANFELVGEKEVFDNYLSKINPGLNVMVATKVYKYKGYHHTYSVMEDANSAIQRAVMKRAKLDKQLSESSDVPSPEPKQKGRPKKVNG